MCSLLESFLIFVLGNERRRETSIEHGSSGTSGPRLDEVNQTEDFFRSNIELKLHSMDANRSGAT